MAKVKNKKKKAKVIKESVQEIEKGRTGGQIALKGFDYQMLFSCYAVLNFLDADNKTIKLEGIEDVDIYKSVEQDGGSSCHIQLKYSQQVQDASFFDGILKNFLEVYLTDKENDTRFFKLVYDTTIAKGNLSKLIENKLDAKSKEYWIEKIKKIKTEKPDWNWTGFNLDSFLKKLQFEKLPKSYLEDKIRSLIIEKFLIDTGNEAIFINGLFYNIFHIAQSRGVITYQDLLKLFQEIKDDIAKGYVNPAYQWINKINFNSTNVSGTQEDFFEGKKATVEDIINGLPIRRENWEKAIEQSIRNNRITVIRSSSGQGKTTLAWQTAYNLKDEYSVYQLNWCKDSKELNNIVEYFNARLKVGEKLLIVLDNLNVDLIEWNTLSQLLEKTLVLNYSILVTAREEDWHAYSGEQSSLRGLRIIDLSLDKEQAQKIYEKLRSVGKIHGDVLNWQSSWEKIKDKKLLIEYIYLLTHGEMLEKRLEAQLQKISKQENSKIKLDLLREITLADTIGVKLSIAKLYQHHERETKFDINEILKSIEREYLIKVNNNQGYVEGLHPVRSSHIVEHLHEYYPIQITLESLIDIVDELYVGQIYSQLPLYLKTEKETFYNRIAEKDKKKSYTYITQAIQGVIAGSVLQYYLDNKPVFDDADKHGGLFLLLNEINPWNDESYGVEVKTLTEMNNIMPQNENIQHLLRMATNIPKFNIKNSDFYLYAYYLYCELKDRPLKRKTANFAALANWLIRVDERFDIISHLNFQTIWNTKEDFDLEELAQLMFEYHKLSRDAYNNFIAANKEDIFSYIRIKTQSLELYEEANDIYIKYILLPQDYNNANKESVNRIETVCKFLPIYNTYCADGIMPKIDIIDQFLFHNESSKRIPFRNVVLSFNSDLSKLWSGSILSHYEFTSVYDWQSFWINIRKKVIEFFQHNAMVLEKLLKGQKINKTDIESLNDARQYIGNSLISENLFPHEKRPFEKPSEVNQYTSKMKLGYFSSISNYLDQFTYVVERKTSDNLCNIALINLKDALKSLSEMQERFRKVCDLTEYYFDIEELESQEQMWLDRIILLNEYYLEHPIGRGFDRHSVKQWIHEKEQSFIKDFSKKIDIAMESSEFTFIKPQTVFRRGSLTTIPLGIKNIDIADESKLIKLFLSLIALADIDAQYIVLIFLDEDLRANMQGMQFNIELLKRLKTCIEYDEEFEMGLFTTPYPCDITRDHLKCFSEEIKINKQTRGIEFEGVDLFLLSLWTYSQYKSYIDMRKGSEKVYLEHRLKELVYEIDQYFDLFKLKIPTKFAEQLAQLRQEVTSTGKIINDEELNYWFNKLILIAQKQ